MSDSEEKIIVPERSTGISGGILYGVGCGIGGSIFTLLGPAIDRAGPGVLISLILGGVLIFLTALNFSELATSLRISGGGGYTFSKEALGGFLAFIIGFFLWIANMAACSFSAQAFAIVIYTFFPILTDYSIFISILSIFFIVFIVFKTSQRATKTLISLTILLILFLVIFIISGILIAPITNATDFDINYLLSGTNIFGVIFTFSSLFICFASIVANLAYLSSDLKNPSKNIPRVNIIAIIITLLLYLLITFVVLVNIGNDIEGISQSDVLLADILNKILGPFGFILMGIAAIISTLIAMNAALGSAVSILFALARDNYVSKRLKKVNKKTGMPIYALIITGFLSLLFTVFTDLGFAAEMTSFIFFFGLAFINFGAVMLRNKRKELDRPFKAPFFPYLPILVGSMCLIFAFTLSMEAILLGVIIFIIGIAYYVLTIADRNSIVLTISGLKFLSTCVLGVFIWIIANFAIIYSTIDGFNVIFREIILRILIYIGIFTFGTVLLDVIPLREMVYYYIKKANRDMIAIGDGRIIELKESRLKLIHNVNYIIGILQLIGGLFVFFVIGLISTDIITLEQILLGNTLISQQTAESLSIMVLTLFGIAISVSGILQLYTSLELSRLRI